MKQRKNYKFGLWTASAFVIANMIGTGVFTSLGFQLEQTTNFIAIAILWLLGGVIALCGALVYGELGAVMPRSGGEYHFLTELYSPFVGFLAGWVSLAVGFAAPVALASLAFSSYLAGWLPGLDPRVVAVAVLTVLTVIHAFSLRFSGKMQGALTLLKIVFIVAFILLGFAMPVEHQGIKPSLDGFGWHIIFNPGFAVSIIWVYYAYSGWNASAYIADDMKRPQRTLPQSLLLSTLAVTLMYLLLNAVFLLTTPAADMAGKVEIGLIAANRIFGSGIGSMMGIAIALLLLSSISSMIFVGPRVSCRMGEDHRLLGFLQIRSKRRIPVVALLVQFALSLVMILTGSFRFITEYTGILLSLCSLLTVLGVFRHRRRFPSMERPFRTPLYPLTPVIFAIPILVSVVYLCVTNWMNLAVSAGILLLGAAVYLMEKLVYKI